MLNGLDLFSGIGGISLALQPWVRPVAYCEIDRYCQATLCSRMHDKLLAEAPIWDDICTLQGSAFRGQVDIIYGGFPCQDISLAGNGAGLEGKRSGLFFQIARLVSEIRPRFVFLENVPAIRTRGASIVAGKLASLGYDCRWDLLSAANVGAPHIRERWWLLAHAHGQRELQQSGIIEPKRRRACDGGDEVANADSERLQKREKNRLSTNSLRSAERGSSLEYASSGRYRPSQSEVCSGRDRPEHASWWEFEPDVGRVANGIPHRVDRIGALGNSVVPAQAREAFMRLMGLK